MQGNKLNYQFLLHFIIFIWGFTAVLGALISIESIPLVWYRMLLASAFLLAFLLFKKRTLYVDSKTLLKFVLGGVIIALHWITFFSAIKASNVSVALMAMSTGAFFTSLIEPFFFKRSISKMEIFLGLVVVIGLYVIFQVEGKYMIGIIFGLVSSLLSSMFSVANGLYVRKSSPEIVSFYQLLFGTIFITTVLFFKGEFTSDFFKLSQTDWIYLLILSSICTAFAFTMSVKVMKVLSPYTVMLSINLEPVYGIILALAVFGDKEKMGVSFYLGTVIILVSVVLNAIYKNKKLRFKRFQKK